MASTGNHGRTVKGKRGIGSGKKSEATSTGKPGSAVVPKGKGDGLGGKKSGGNPGKGKNAKNMGGKY